MLAPMVQLPLFQNPSWSVSGLTQYLRQLLESDELLQDVWVMGEVSNCTRHSSGHFYFTLKDGTAALKCVMWRNAAMRQAYLPRDGDAIEVHGGIGVYETVGVYQLYADAIRPAGEGLLYQAFLQLKNRLEAEGLFDPARKRQPPRWPKVIGVVTSPTGAALRDILNTLRRRYPLARVVLSPTAVQGDEAPLGILRALAALNRVVQPDVILLARGGGSIEDLWAFNDERVARAIVASEAPVICGVGHETDFTIADFSADLRAPTPTAAAELATPDQFELRSALVDQTTRLKQAMRDCLDEPAWQVDNLKRRLALQSPVSQIRSGLQRVDDLSRRAEIRLKHRLQMRRLELTSLEQRLAALNPQAVLQRGYALVYDQAGKVVRHKGQAIPGERLTVQVSDGRFAARVEPGESHD